MRDFWRDRCGSYAMATAIAMVPLMGALALAVDFSEMTRQKQATLSALDAAGIATARQMVSGSSEQQTIAYANAFFAANLGPVKPADTKLLVTLPSNQAGGGTLKLAAELTYQPYFFPAFQQLLGTAAPGDTTEMNFTATTEIR